jgi:hypothetical protein
MHLQPMIDQGHPAAPMLQRHLDGIDNGLTVATACGVTILAGTDERPHGSVRDEVIRLHEYGLPLREISVFVFTQPVIARRRFRSDARVGCRIRGRPTARRGRVLHGCSVRCVVGTRPRVLGLRATPVDHGFGEFREVDRGVQVPVDRESAVLAVLRACFQGQLGFRCAASGARLR